MITTPNDRSDEHEFWHRFEKGICLWCGWYCIDCPIGVATCKCESEEQREEEFKKVVDEFDSKHIDERKADFFLMLENRGITDSWVE